MVRPQELWGRRSVAIGVVLVVLAVIGGIVLLVTGGGGGGSSSNNGSGITELQDKLLKKTVVVPAKGIQVRVPPNWTVIKRQETIRLRSQDSCLIMTLAAPSDAGKETAVMKQGVSYLRDNFKGVSVRPAAPSQVGGIPTRTNAISLRNPKGEQVNFVISVGTGKKFTYVTNVSASPTCTADLTVGQVVLSSVQYTK